jgi:transcriptional regulator
MIEGRARSQVRRARLTIEFFELIQNQYEVSTESGTKLQQIPMIVLQEADRHKIHLRSNMVEILRMVKKLKTDSLSSDGRVNEKLIFSFNERGKLYLR